MFGVKYLTKFNSYLLFLICSEIVKEKLNMFILAPTNLSGIFGCK